MVTQGSPKFKFAHFFLIIIIIIQCSGMFLYVPGCSMFLVLSTALAQATIWSAQIGQVTLRFFSQTEQLCLEMDAYAEELSTVGNQLKSICISILSGGGNVSTEYYPGSFRAIGSKYKVSGATVSNVWKTFCQTGEKC